MAKTCSECRWCQLMKYEAEQHCCKSKESPWYAINLDRPACEHFEKKEDMVRLMEDRGLG